MTRYGRATPAGTAAYAQRFASHAAGAHFRSTAAGFSVSSIGIGTYLGEPDDATDEAYQAAVERALALGCNHIDTAINYRHQRSERAIGQALRAFGFTVIDLGEDVQDERFLEAVRAHRPDVLCLSGLISIAFESMKRVVDLVRADSRALGYMPPVVLGGGTVDSEVCQYAGADSWSTDAMEGVRICEGLVAERGRAKGGDAAGS